MRSIKKKHFNKKDLEKKLRFTKSKKINGKNIKKSDKEKYLIMSAMKKLEEKQLITYPELDSLTVAAIDLLGSFGMAVNTSLDADLDLKQTVTDTETINNPNIEDKNLKNLKNKKKNAKDKFPDPDDSFYKLGKKQRLFKQKQAESAGAEQMPELAIQKVAAAISEINLDPSESTTLEEFK
jgi:hypothetical protein